LADDIPISREMFSVLFNNLLTIEERVVSVYLFDRDGLIICSESRNLEDKEKEEILGAITGKIDLILQHVKSEFKLGNWSTGTFETEEHRLFFLEAGADAILLLITEFDLPMNHILPYAFLVAEKVARITRQDFYDGFTTNIPKLQVETGSEGSLLDSLQKKTIPLEQYKPGVGLNFYSMDTFQMSYKTIIIGDLMVGKTTLVQKFATGKFRKDYIPTLGISITEKVYSLLGDEKTQVNFMIWDLAGQKFFKRARTVYIKGAQAAFLVYDCTNRETFEDIPEWYTEVVNDTVNIPIVLVANKIDLKQQRVISTEEGQALAKKLRCYYIETSALTGENVNEAFQLLGIGLFFKTNQDVSKKLKL